MKIALVAVLALPCAFAVRCYNYIETSDDLNPVKSWLDCDESPYCIKTTYSEDETLNIVRSCGPSGVCKTEYCARSRDALSCCCRGELCNL